MSIRYVIDDVLPQNIYSPLEQLVTGEDFNWYMKIGTLGSHQSNLGDWRFMHIIYKQGYDVDKYFPSFEPVIDFLNPYALMGSKINCDIYTPTCLLYTSPSPRD